tara:strand:- start:269 stop:475 length:207 start_codon:yes stop_codon:yes gene_type:complete
MITFKNELPLDHTKSIEFIVNTWTKEIQEENRGRDMGVGWDSCNETAWHELEWWLEDYGFELEGLYDE